MIMNKIALAALAVPVMLLTAAPAHADETTYLEELRDTGWAGSDEVLLDLGRKACNDWDHGVSRGTIVDYIYDNTGDETSRDEAMEVFVAATTFLC